MTPELTSDAIRPGNRGNMILLLALIAMGWMFALAQVLTIDAAGSLAEAGPGMQIFAYAKAHLFGDPFAFETSISFCATPTGAWGASDLMKAFAMWLGMIFAMMMPTLVPIASNGKGDEMPLRAFLIGLSGYVVAWVPFCLAGVALQWGLQQTGAFTTHYVIQNEWLSVGILTFVALVYLFGLTLVVRAHRPAFNMQGDPANCDFQAGFAYGLHCLRCCGALMMVMFVAGLMNLLAMITLTVLMSVLMVKLNRRFSIYIGFSTLGLAAFYAVA